MIPAGCVASASHAYGIPRASIMHVLRKPTSAGGIGQMHIPETWLPILARVGFSAAKVAVDPCTNIIAGAWIISFEALEKGKLAHQVQGSTGGPGGRISVASLAKREGVPAVCITRAASQYHLPLPLFAGVLATEGARVGEVHVNKNGSTDIGPAQVNSIWLPRLKRSGITRAVLLKNGCVNVAVGAWILARAMKGADPTNPAGYWKHVGDYNSATPRYNRRYARLVWRNVVRERK